MALIAGVETAVTVARPGQRPWGTLVTTFPRGIATDARLPSANWIWGNGAVIVADACGDVNVSPIDCEDEQLAAAEEWGDEVAFQPFKVDMGRRCGILSGRSDEELTAAARRRINEWMSAALARELYLGTLTSNPAITVSPTVLTVAAALPVQQAFQLLEQHIATRIGNMQATIHVTPAMFADAARMEIITDSHLPRGGTPPTSATTIWDGSPLPFNEGMDGPESVWVTATGHMVVGDAGYDGSIPTGSPVDENGDPVVPAALGAGEEYIYVTGPIAWDYGPELIFDVEDLGVLIGETRSATGRQNKRRSFVQRPAIAIFDPSCIHLAVLALHC